MKSLGIDLGGTSAKLGVVEDGIILASASVVTRADSDYEGIRARPYGNCEKAGRGTPYQKNRNRFAGAGGFGDGKSLFFQ